MLQLEFCSRNWSMLLWWASNYKNTLLSVSYFGRRMWFVDSQLQFYLLVTRVSFSNGEPLPDKSCMLTIAFQEKISHLVLLDISQQLFDILLVSPPLCKLPILMSFGLISLCFVLQCVECQKLTLSLHFNKPLPTKPLATSRWFKG